MFQFLKSVFSKSPPPRRTWEVRDDFGKIEIEFQSLSKRREAKIKKAIEWLDQLRKDLNGKYLVHWSGEYYTYYIVNETFTSSKGKPLWRLNLFDQNLINDDTNDIAYDFTIGISICEDSFGAASATINVQFEIDADVTIFSNGKTEFEYSYDYSDDEDYDPMEEERDSISYQKSVVSKMFKEVQLVEKKFLTLQGEK